MSEISQSDFNIFKAKAISRGKLLDRFRLTMIEVKDHIEDEGDRVYFGSSNDAEALKEVVQEMDALRWDRIIAERPEIDPYEECRKLRESLERMVNLAEARLFDLEAMAKALEQIKALDYTRAAVNGAAHSAHVIASDALASYRNREGNGNG